MESTNFSKYDFLAKLGLEETNNGCYTNGEWLGGDVIVDSIFPHDNSVNGKVRLASAENYEYCIQSMLKEKKKWMNTPAPVRGDILRQVGAKLKEFQDEIGSLIALEVGKTKPEGDFEPGDSFNVCNYACGLSRDIAGRIAPSEKPGHVILENWNPLGIVGVITAFNFPCLVFCWTAVNALMCGNMVLWKGAPTTPLCSIAISKIFVDVLKENGFNSVFSLCQGDGVEIGQLIANDKRVPLVSFTGSVKVGKIVSAAVNKRMGRCLLELGGNNAAIVLNDANIDHAVQEIYAFNLQVSGQCCTSIRRVLIEESVYDEVVEKLVAKYKATVAGDPFDSSSNMGPLHSKLGIDIYTKAIKAIKEQGGKILTGGNVKAGDGNYVEATVVEIDRNSEIVQEESFAPIVYVFKIKDLDDAIEYNNSVSQGLNSTLFTNDLRNYFKWIGPGGSDCGLVNCNISEGAETGCAFGGEKETGGGRVSGSDSWKQYMRRSTCMLNYSVTN